jgi:hypothetical protein
MDTSSSSAAVSASSGQQVRAAASQRRRENRQRNPDAAGRARDTNTSARRVRREQDPEAAGRAQDADTSARRSQRSISRANDLANRDALDVRIENLLNIDAFTDEDKGLIETHAERHVAAALALFASNTTVAFGLRTAVSMEAQVSTDPYLHRHLP